MVQVDFLPIPSLYCLYLAESTRIAYGYFEMTSKEPSKNRRSGGRKSRMASRSVNDPDRKVVRSGLTGGRDAPLLPAEVETIIGRALDVLAEVGVGFPTPEVAAEAMERDAAVDDGGRLHLPH